MDTHISVDCDACFTAHNVPVKFAGKRVKCPSCKATMTVPAPRGQRTASKSPPVRKARPADETDDVDFLDDDELDDDLEELPAPRKKSGSGKKKKAAAAGGFFGPENKALSWGPWGGVLLMVIAVVWFVVGLMGNVIFYYPPILFIFGLVGTIKALISRE